MDTRPRRIVTDSMIGMRMPDYARYSERVITILGQNPSPFTGPGTNTYLIGTGPRPILLDTGQGVALWAEFFVRVLDEFFAGEGLDRVVLTHAHPDHIGGVGQVQAKFRATPVMKKPWPGHDGAAAGMLVPIEDGAVIKTDGATLRALHTPGHSPDHLCYYLEEERALFTGDVVLGAGTTVIPDETGDLGDYMRSLDRLLAVGAEIIYPAHGPVIRNPRLKITEYIAHRELRDRQILEVLSDSEGLEVARIVTTIYSDVPEYLHPAAANSVRSHLKKLRKEGRVVEHEGRWSLC